MRVTHAGLRRQVHHAVEAFRAEQRLQRGAVGHVDALETEARPCLQLLQPGGFQRRVVVVVEVVDAHHLIAALQQSQ
jgi:hypothetical protein